MMDRDFTLEQNAEPESAKRSPAIEYGYDKNESPYAGCVDCFEVFERMLNACYVKEII